MGEMFEIKRDLEKGHRVAFYYHTNNFNSYIFIYG